MEASENQLRDFGGAVEAQMARLALSVPDLAGKLGLNYETVRQYLRGGREPTRATVFTLERELQVEPGTLSAYLGYLPVDAADVRPMRVTEAIALDIRLDERGKRALTDTYLVLVGQA